MVRFGINSVKNSCTKDSLVRFLSCSGVRVIDGIGGSRTLSGHVGAHSHVNTPPIINSSKNSELFSDDSGCTNGSLILCSKSAIRCNKLLRVDGSNSVLLQNLEIH